MHSRKKGTGNKQKSKRKRIKVKLSLTKRRTRAIKYAHQITENKAKVNFFYADMNGNPKLRLHNSIDNKYVCEFKSRKIT